MYVGDTDTDMQTGNAAGMYTVGVLWGFRDRTELETHHAHRIISEPGELLKIRTEHTEFRSMLEGKLEEAVR
jgi:phosphoglycolate phosphatase